MSTANENYFDASIRHQIGIRRLTAGEVNRVLALMEKADRELVMKIRERLTRLGSVEDFTSRRLALLLADVRDARAEMIRQVRRQTTGTLLELGGMEVDFEQRLIQTSVPIDLRFAAVDAAVLREIVFRRPFQGRLLREQFQALSAADRRNLTAALQLGLAQGESVQQIVRRVAGTRAENFRDGALAITRRNAETVVRTSINHVSNASREALWDANEDMIAALRWTATLDGRTSPVCRGRDGKLAPIGGKDLPEGSQALSPPGARPPAHMSCRSVMIAVLDGEGILGTRPTVVSTKTRRRREIDFRRMAREQGRPIQEIRREWAERNIGAVPASTSYDQFLRRQPAGFQDEVLGQTKGRLFRQGDLEMDQFIDRRGNELTLAQLSDTEPEAFVAANLDPGDF